MLFRVAGKPVKIDEDLIDERKEKVKSDVSAYLRGKRIEFSYEIDFSGLTKFQREVMKEMRKIPYGETISYGRLAIRSGYPMADRGVGSVCGKNTLPIIVPCHRVVAKNSIGGYAFGTDVKRRLLGLEGRL